MVTWQRTKPTTSLCYLLIWVYFQHFSCSWTNSYLSHSITSQPLIARLKTDHKDQYSQHPQHPQHPASCILHTAYYTCASRSNRKSHWSHDANHPSYHFLIIFICFAFLFPYISTYIFQFACQLVANIIKINNISLFLYFIMIGTFKCK